MFWLRLDLDELGLLDRTVRGFGHNRRALASIHDGDYAGPGPGSIRAKITARLHEGGVSEPVGRITMYTMPRVCGYVFNPVSFYVCYAPDETLVALVAEVHNTFGEGHHYVMRPERQPDDSRESVVFRATKVFTVSPFLEVSGGYEVSVRESDDGLELLVQLEQGGELMFTATMCGRTMPMNSRTLARTLFGLPLLAATIMLRIHWQALQLSVMRRLRVFPRMGVVTAATFTAVRPSFWHRLRAAAVDRASRRHTLRTGIPPPQQLPMEHS
jgi:DUF1365 family protein